VAWCPGGDVGSSTSLSFSTPLCCRMMATHSRRRLTHCRQPSFRNFGKRRRSVLDFVVFAQKNLFFSATSYFFFFLLLLFTFLIKLELITSFLYAEQKLTNIRLVTRRARQQRCRQLAGLPARLLFFSRAIFLHLPKVATGETPSQFNLTLM